MAWCFIIPDLRLVSSRAEVPCRRGVAHDPAGHEKPA